jgi:hypothetical protein
VAQSLVSVQPPPPEGTCPNAFEHV